MTTPAERTGLEGAPRAERWAGQGNVPPDTARRAVLLASLIVGSAIAAALFAHAPGAKRFFDNAHWTLSYASAALLAWLGAHHAAANERTARRWFARGLSAYAFGQLLWDAQVAMGWNPFPGPSDIFYLLLGPCCALGFAAGLRERTTPAQRRVTLLDVGALSIAALALTLATYLPVRGNNNLLQLAVLMAYPVGLFTAACFGLVLMPTLRLRPSAGWLLLLGAVLANAALWMSWNARTLANTLADGTLYNALFSVNALAMGVGAMCWSTHGPGEPRWERRFEGALRLLPLLVVVCAALAMLIVFTLPRTSPLVVSSTAICGACVVTLAVVRQNLLLRERDQLLEAERKFRTLFDSAPDAILLMSGERFVDCNPRAEHMFGLSRAELCRRTPFEVSPERQPDGRSSREAAGEHIANALRGDTASFDWEHIRADGSTFPAEVKLTGVDLSSGRILQAVVRDSSERLEAEGMRRRLEEQLRQAAKLEAVGRLAGGVAHDFNNLLTVILGTLELSLARLRPDEPLARDLHETRLAAQRAAGLTAQLLAFSRKQVVAPIALNLHARVEQAFGMLRRLIGEDIELDFAKSGETCTVMADPTQLEQLLVNLAVNARDAMPDGGRLMISTSRVEVGEDLCREYPDARPGSFGRLVVEDTGPGITAEIAGQIFEPFFTTKEHGRGTGLGLATVYGILRQCGGFIVLRQDAGRGARFECHLPAVAAEPKAWVVSRPGTRAGGHETVLLVEDEPTLRDLVRRMLVSLGYQVVVAESGPHALALPTQTIASVDLVLTDVVMPGMSGRRMYELLLASRPGLGVVYMSGYTDQIIAPHGVLESGTYFLQKPFVQDDLAAILRAALDHVAAL